MAYVLSVYSNQAAFVSDLVRPLTIALVMVAGLQVVLTLVLRDQERGALATAIAIALVPSQPIVLIGLLAVAAFLTIPRRVALARASGTRTAPWRAATGLLNVLTLVLLILSVAGLAFGGR